MGGLLDSLTLGHRETVSVLRECMTEGSASLSVSSQWSARPWVWFRRRDDERRVLVVRNMKRRVIINSSQIRGGGFGRAGGDQLIGPPSLGRWAGQGRQAYGLRKSVGEDLPLCW